MRGAGLRLNVDVRRHWRCPACGAERRLPATVTSVRCVCSGNPHLQLVEGQRRDRTPVPLPDMVLEFDLSNDPVTIPENLPVPDPNQRMGRPGPRGRRHGGPDQPPGLGQAPPNDAAQSAPGIRPPEEGAGTEQSGDRDSRRGQSQRRGDGPPGQDPRPRRSRDRPRREAAQSPAAPADEGVLPKTEAANDAASRQPVSPAPPPPPVQSPAEDFGAGLENSGG